MHLPWTSRPPEADAENNGTVQDRRPQPTGNLPRQAQTWTILGLASLMIVVLVFAGRPTSPRVTKPAGTAMHNDSARAIEEYQQRLDEEQRRLEGPPPSPTPHEGAPAGSTDPRTDSNRSGAADERAQRAYTSLFADQVAFSASGRKLETGNTFGPKVPQSVSDPAAQYAVALTQLAQRTAASPAGPAGASSGPDHGAAPAATPPHMPPTTLPPPTGTYRLAEGSLLATMLTHRLDGELASPVTCLVTADVYAPGYQVVLVPAGSWVIGESRSVSSVGQRRLAILFHRILRPDGSSIALDALATSNMGEAGLQSHVDTHYWSTFAAAGAVGLIAGLAEASTNTGLDATLLDHYRQGVAGSLSQSSLHILDAYLNRLPTIRVDEGTFVTVRLLADVDIAPALPASPSSPGGALDPTTRSSSLRSTP